MLTHLTSLPLHFGFQISEMVTEHRYDVSLVCTQTNIFEQRQKPFQENDQSLHQPQDTCHPKPIIQTMISSSTASRNGRVLRLSILSTDRMAILLLSLNASVPTKIQWFLNFYIQRLLGQLSESSLSKHLTCVSRTYSQLQPTNLTYFSPLISRQVVGALTCPNTSLVSPGPTPNLSLSRYSQCSSPGKLSELSLVQTPHLCLQDPLPTSACRDTHNHFENMSFQAIN